MLITTVLFALLAFAAAQTMAPKPIEYKCYPAPTLRTKLEWPKEDPKKILDFDKLQALVDKKNAEIESKKPTPKILSFEELHKKFGNKLSETFKGLTFEEMKKKQGKAKARVFKNKV